MPVLGEGRRLLHTFAICHGVGEAEHVSAHPIGSVVLAVSPTRMKNMDAQACHHSELIYILSVAGPLGGRAGLPAGFGTGPSNAII